MEVLYLLSYRSVFCWWGREDSNLRRLCRQVYSLLPLAARAHPHGTPEDQYLWRLHMVAKGHDFSTDTGSGPVLLRGAPATQTVAVAVRAGEQQCRQAQQ